MPTRDSIHDILHTKPYFSIGLRVQYSFANSFRCVVRFLIFMVSLNGSAP